MASEDKGDDKYAVEDFSKYLPDSAKKDQPSQQWQFPTQTPSRVSACFERIKTGAMLGGALGGSFGFLYGTYAAIAYRHILYVPISVVQAGFGFGLFLACGMVIRCEEPELCSGPYPGPYSRTHFAYAHQRRD
mmetsp:Transcript_16235/g.47340  ORF Transcript_16235/g.47340 Transcript_16235/m.47340 type:complete len:133 (-) Transcript_16235:455-853(-)